MGKVVTRFAPSPTGFLHAGNYRTAVFAYLFAKKNSGDFILRIEDTDKERSKKEFEENILETLEWLNLKHDAFYRQSEHKELHEQEIKKLIAEDKAYISKEEGEGLAQGAPVAQGKRSEVIRFRNPKKPLTFTDAIRGPITIDTSDLGDFIIARSVSEPVFHFAVVVDDAAAGITHVIRGDDHISNTPRQILIGQALGYAMPIYAHLPLVLGPDRTKLSKRRGARALTEYRDEGYLPEAVINYLALIGWHPENDKEIFSVTELIETFDLARIQKSAGIFDEVKLHWVNHEHSKRLTDDEFKEQFFAYLTSRGESIPSYFEEVLPIIRERSATFGEAAHELKNEFDFLEHALSYDVPLLLKGAKAEPSEIAKHISKIIETLQTLRDRFSAQEVKDAIFPYATEAGRSAVLWPMRVALSGKEKSPDPFVLSALLGKQETIERLNAAQNMLK
ncbi:MAG TPA: glutamate--tRNA ligase family protein [Candidatus Paceibacterota bacterium]|nr:glutamate--tRNA ligase family protein [Candidatus Paceibacterota bacterium]